VRRGKPFAGKSDEQKGHSSEVQQLRYSALDARIVWGIGGPQEGAHAPRTSGRRDVLKQPWNAAMVVTVGSYWRSAVQRQRAVTLI
jgi:hypothetical protein